jgi:hypothetical protein
MSIDAKKAEKANEEVKEVVERPEDERNQSQMMLLREGRTGRLLCGGRI